MVLVGECVVIKDEVVAIRMGKDDELLVLDFVYQIHCLYKTIIKNITINCTDRIQHKSSE